MFDLSTLNRLALDGTDVVLRPVFDPSLRIFSVQLWENDEIRAVHGWTDNFRDADEPLEAIDAFLAERGVRAVTDEEAVLLYAGLVQAEGGVDWQIMQMQIAAQGQD
ncbi:hypothetical protein ACIQRC_34430 [Streptomyces californicus]|uniref:hypothetical protein n=1 Tax=Streptomyces californicus TaxID=67351 RepID=UPI00382509B2